MPDFPLEEIEDYYTYFVEIVGLSENLFWNSDYDFLQSVAANKQAYDAWYNQKSNKIRERMAKDAGRR